MCSARSVYLSIRLSIYACLFVCRYGRACARRDRSKLAQYTLPQNDLEYMSRLAPAIMNNYYLRSLLGKHAHCA